MAVFMSVMYWAARDFGAAAQAGLGVGMRINQMILVPALVLAFAAAPIAGQNFGARNWARVRETFRVAVLCGAMVMVVLTLVVQWQAASLARIFTADPAVIGVAATLLTYLSWNFIPAVVTFTCSSLFQAMGNTWPAFGASAIRIVIFVLPAVWMARQPWFELRHIFMLSVTTVFVHCAIACLWLQAEMRKRLSSPPAEPPIRQSA
jgi:Na+-driven multidrug efflux pump